MASVRNIQILDRKYVSAGEMIIKQGTAGSNAYVIASGRVEVFSTTAKGETVKLAELGPGSLIGELAMQGDADSSASVRALEETTLLPISARDFGRTSSKSARKEKGGLFSFISGFFLWLVK